MERRGGEGDPAGRDGGCRGGCWFIVEREACVVRFGEEPWRGIGGKDEWEKPEEKSGNSWEVCRGDGGEIGRVSSGRGR